MDKPAVTVDADERAISHCDETRSTLGQALEAAAAADDDLRPRASSAHGSRHAADSASDVAGAASAAAPAAAIAPTGRGRKDAMGAPKRHAVSQAKAASSVVASALSKGAPAVSAAAAAGSDRRKAGGGKEKAARSKSRGRDDAAGKTVDAPSAGDGNGAPGLGRNASNDALRLALASPGASAISDGSSTVSTPLDAATAATPAGDAGFGGVVRGVSDAANSMATSRLGSTGTTASDGSSVARSVSPATSRSVPHDAPAASASIVASQLRDALSWLKQTAVEAVDSAEGVRDLHCAAPAAPPGPKPPAYSRLPKSLHPHPTHPWDGIFASYRVKLGVGVLVRCFRDFPVAPSSAAASVPPAAAGAAASGADAAPAAATPPHRRKYGLLYRVVEVTFPSPLEDPSCVPTTRSVTLWLGDDVLNRRPPKPWRDALLFGRHVCAPLVLPAAKGSATLATSATATPAGDGAPASARTSSEGASAAAGAMPATAPAATQQPSPWRMDPVERLGKQHMGLQYLFDARARQTIQELCCEASATAAGCRCGAGAAAAAGCGASAGADAAAAAAGAASAPVPAAAHRPPVQLRSWRRTAYGSKPPPPSSTVATAAAPPAAAAPAAATGGLSVPVAARPLAVSFDASADGAAALQTHGAAAEYLLRNVKLAFTSRPPRIVSTSSSRVLLRNGLRCAIRRTQLPSLHNTGLSGRWSNRTLDEPVIWMQLPVPNDADDSKPPAAGAAPDFLLHIGIAAEDDALEMSGDEVAPWVLELPHLMRDADAYWSIFRTPAAWASQRFLRGVHVAMSQLVVMPRSGTGDSDDDGSDGILDALPSAARCQHAVLDVSEYSNLQVGVPPVEWPVDAGGQTARKTLAKLQAIGATCTLLNADGALLVLQQTLLPLMSMAPNDHLRERSLRPWQFEVATAAGVDDLYKRSGEMHYLPRWPSWRWTMRGRCQPDGRDSDASLVLAVLLGARLRLEVPRVLEQAGLRDALAFEREHAAAASLPPRLQPGDVAAAAAVAAARDGAGAGVDGTTLHATAAGYVSINRTSRKPLVPSNFVLGDAHHTTYVQLVQACRNFHQQLEQANRQLNGGVLGVNYCGHPLLFAPASTLDPVADGLRLLYRFPSADVQPVTDKPVQLARIAVMAKTVFEAAESSGRAQARVPRRGAAAGGGSGGKRGRGGGKGGGPARGGLAGPAGRLTAIPPRVVAGMHACSAQDVMAQLQMPSHVGGVVLWGCHRTLKLAVDRFPQYVADESMLKPSTVRTSAPAPACAPACRNCCRLCLRLSALCACRSWPSAATATSRLKIPAASSAQPRSTSCSDAHR